MTTITSPGIGLVMSGGGRRHLRPEVNAKEKKEGPLSSHYLGGRSPEGHPRGKKNSRVAEDQYQEDSHHALYERRFIIVLGRDRPLTGKLPSS